MQTLINVALEVRCVNFLVSLHFDYHAEIPVSVSLFVYVCREALWGPVLFWFSGTERQ